MEILADFSRGISKIRADGIYQKREADLTTGGYGA